MSQQDCGWNEHVAYCLPTSFIVSLGWPSESWELKLVQTSYSKQQVDILLNLKDHSVFQTSTISRCTVWFKINLTLFKSHISCKWLNMVNLLMIFKRCGILGGCGESGIKIDAQILKWEPKIVKRYTHVKSMDCYSIHLCTTRQSCTDISIIDCAVCISIYEDTTVQASNTTP